MAYSLKPLSPFTMAKIAKQPNIFKSSISSNDSSLNGDSAIDEQIPTVDYSLLFSDDPRQQSLALDHLGQACHDYGFFYVSIASILVMHYLFHAFFLWCKCNNITLLDIHALSSLIIVMHVRATFHICLFTGYNLN